MDTFRKYDYGYLIAFGALYLIWPGLAEWFAVPTILVIGGLLLNK